MSASASPTVAAQPAVHKKPEGLDLYSRFAVAGALGCSITLMEPLPPLTVKTKIQLDLQTYSRGMIGSFRQVIQNEVAGALLTGFGPTFTGYFLQGAFKFGGYEFFKQQLIDIIGLEKARANRALVYSVSAASVEFFASIALCPLEATRIRLVSTPGFSNGLVGGFSKILTMEGIGAFYSGFGPILFKQIPYTVTKFVAFEKFSEAILARVDKSKLSPSSSTAVNLGSDLLAGFTAAIVCQPADTMLSKINKTKGLLGEGVASRLIKIAGELGIRGSLVFAIYGDIKEALGATNGVEIAK